MGGGVFCLSRDSIFPWGNRALWYVRSLLIFMILTMGVNFIIQRLKVKARVALVPMLTFVIILLVSHFFMSLGPSSSGLYFSIGMFLSKKVLAAKRIRISSALYIGGGFLLFALVLRSGWFCLGHDFYHWGGTILANMSTIMVIAGIWFIVDAIPVTLFHRQLFQSILPLSAIIYFMHYPINDAIKYLSKGFNHDCVFLVLLIGAPILYVALALIMKNHLRRVYSILSGGR